ITTNLNNGYAKFSGTSFSAPQVAALAALIKTFDPGMPPAQVEQILEDNADKIGQYPYTNGHNDYFGHGRINALQAVLEAENGVWYNAYQNKSLQSNATYSNSSRHLVRGAGYLHEVFTSGGEIFYRRSDDDGPASPSGRQNWQVTKRISGGNVNNSNPCITWEENGNKLHAVWERVPEDPTALKENSPDELLASYCAYKKNFPC
ncbi:MAG: S8 family serine peptidase, partial [Gammaproteobacteria bacterium]|nr:S8 family serine peptidase [Gammaproteobacteria bacterium]NIW45831.1 S8 family serine peptidase [Gammaproteobacteria bacterium]NIW97009.1 S8 family serine peptidase [Phycisphaerae bacterium]